MNYIELKHSQSHVSRRDSRMVGLHDAYHEVCMRHHFQKMKAAHICYQQCRLWMKPLYLGFVKRMMAKGRNGKPLLHTLPCPVFFQVKLNSRRLNLVQYLPENLFWICWLEQSHGRCQNSQLSQLSSEHLVFPLLSMPVQGHAGSPAWQPRWDILTQVSILRVSVADKQFRWSVSYFWLWGLEWLTLCLTLCLATVRSKAEPLQGSFLNENETRDSNNTKCNGKKERWI